MYRAIRRVGEVFSAKEGAEWHWSDLMECWDVDEPLKLPH